MPAALKTMALHLEQVLPSLSRSDLGWELANIAVGFALLSIALAGVALFFFRRRANELSLIHFGGFCALYAIRLLARAPLFRSLFDEPRAFWDYINWTITCLILIPLSLFLFQVGGEGLKKFFRWFVAAQVVCALFEILAGTLGTSLAKLYTANNIVVLGTLASAGAFPILGKRSLGSISRLTTEVRVFLVGFVVWLLFVLHANLLGLGILKGHNVEFLGFLIFVASLGYISASRIFSNEERLLAIDKELEIARRIQSSIIPKNVPKVTGLEVAARYLPMSAVAGDFYDFLCVDDKRLGILVADVTGHGVPAALIASMLKVAFAGQVAHAHDPACVLSGLNHALCGKFEEHFVTAGYLFLDLEKMVLRYSAAGHPPLLLAAGASGKAQEIEENGLMLGMFPEAVYSFVEIDFRPGDRCLLYTDGVFEAKNGGQEEFGKARLRKFVETHRTISGNQLADDLLAELACWSSDSPHNAKHVQDDDITLVMFDFLSTP